MHVLYVVGYADWYGGIWSHVHKLTCMALGEGLCVSVMAPDVSHKMCIPKEGASYLDLDLSIRRFFIAVRQLRRYIRNQNIQVIHSHGARADMCVALALAQIKEAPVHVST